ncbi:MAG: ABC transporter permease [Patescibacteria group bacterium]|nr:ABC transporter permease [Patescibacteria group bacterium]
MFQTKENFTQWFNLLSVFTEKEIKVRYKRTVLGLTWLIINPIIQTLIIGSIFNSIVGVDIDYYYLYLLAGLLPWNFFSKSILQTTPIFLEQRGLIQKANLPAEIIILSVILSNFLQLIVSLLLLISLSFLVKGVNLTSLVFLPLGLIWLFVITVGVSFLLSTLNTFHRDMQFLIKAFMPLWFYATPIMYQLEQIPGSLRNLISLNPISGLVIFFQAIPLLQSMNRLSLGQISFSLLMAMSVFMLGTFVFVTNAGKFSDYT